ncbi:MAG: rod shape-determining protein [Candidatus Colwellbacteria bacterium RBG_13_48_8]|uniref:Cell shape-determining protein MreB n=1 Tax=Candidatus Colwellbacteria bacterium RBG_13_48_8 TaxID=1797685 RepID=A0A1G1YXR4_9BACT|nr:MAG: rod shape-determining protein [Candidatus Colwellbacteria bacterium RBG_13_48_8]
MFVHRIGIDLGTTNTVVFVPGKGFVIDEPTIVALGVPGSAVLAVGREAKEMLGKTPESIRAYRPLKDGVVADYYITRAILKYFINKAVGAFNLVKPEVVISVPAGITATERRAVENAALEAGARRAYLVREPLLAALGAGITINSSSGNMIINIGGGTAEVAVISLGGIVCYSSLRVAGNKFDQFLIDHVKKNHSVFIGEQTAEAAKIAIGTAVPMKNKLEFQLRGRDLTSGLPKDLIINSNEVAEAINPLLMDIAGSIQSVFNETPPELVADVMEKGMILSGGSSGLRNIDEFFKRLLGVPAYVAEEPILCVAKGTGIILDHLDVYKKTLLSKP